MLVVVLSSDAITLRRSVTGQGQILLQHLMGVAANPALGAVAVEHLVAAGDAAAAATAAAVLLAAAAVRSPSTGTLLRI
ncbi:hypothetical protein amb1620 [Paramagnetospirillum magneticum AMB-1]|uniref:Uncharacterized protein n=1 Tax=Paramagnetospirillum magneticum (strain ATCC 700264 / AMB-1) TaxID=342108 RepID=Q2W6V1_PARM1|nr:hypothetical protein amb1620 [Paramagnetospirillum magneticum AMB-1]